MSTSTPAPSPSFLSRVPLATKIVSIGVVGVLGLVLLAVSMWAGSSAMSSAAERREAQATVTENAARLATLDQRLWNTQLLYVLAVNGGRWGAAEASSPQRSAFLEVLRQKQETLAAFPAQHLTPTQSDALVRLREIDADFAAAEQRGAQFYLARNRESGAREIDASRAVLGEGEAVLTALTDAARAEAQAADAEIAAAKDRQRIIGLVTVAVIGTLLALLAILLARSVAGRMRRVQDTLTGMAGGDLTHATGLAPGDEIGDMAAAADASREAMRRTLTEVGSATEEVAAASTRLAANADELDQGASSATADLERVVGSSSDMSRNVSTVAAGTEEMTASIREIAKSATDAAGVAATAVTVADRTNATIAKLGASSAEIGEVIKAITSIAEQTNLLALNATIEAARAGRRARGSRSSRTRSKIWRRRPPRPPRTSVTASRRSSSTPRRPWPPSPRSARSSPRSTTPRPPSPRPWRSRPPPPTRWAATCRTPPAVQRRSPTAWPWSVAPPRPT
ncbi:hypothetical protein GCM10025883_03000 [Mobilicoccus caccae]|uniref:Methyl-accepting chemotaxis protein n=1 Tax=Mobilicoccus caccae TaxID=1859295 RepID=A0ABQ6IK70_9MICO|nr:hypothetical protein GCM10025883_03000 [Mobilicoccus caccae]